MNSQSNTLVSNDPCSPNGSIGIVEDQTTEKECKKVTDFINDPINTSFKQKLQELSTDANLNLNYEKGVSMFENENEITTYQGDPNEPQFTMSGLPTNKYEAFVHTHPAIGDGTLSVFSPDDLVAIATFIKNNH